MAAPILATKLFRPAPRPSAVARPRLLARLDAGLAGRVSLVAAPAGFGKTTLLASWLRQLELRIENGELRSSVGSDHSSFFILNSQFKVAWLSLDEGEGDPGRFLAYLVAALRSAAPQLGEGVVAALQSAQQPPAEALLTALLNEVAALPGRIILVLDDYHLVDSAPADRALAFLIAHLPAQLHLVIATRAEPRLPLARYRARGQLAELRAADLRFTPAEAAGLLNAALGRALADGEIAALAARTEGWAAGLQLAALSLRGRPDAAAFIRSFAGSDRFVMDYLAEEVLQRQPEAIRSFLLQTSILDRLCGPLCDALVRAEGSGLRAEDQQSQPSALSPQPSALILEELERAGLFLIPLDNERRWYRYHQLFAEVLRRRLAQAAAAGAGPGAAACHRRASAWYAANGMALEALRHAAAAGDTERVAGIAERSWQALDQSFQSAAWLGWVRRLPDAVIRARPVLCVQCAWAQIDGGDLEAGERHLRDAERLLAAGEAGPAAVVVEEAQLRTLPARIATARAYIAQAGGDLGATAAQAELALRLLPEAEQDLRAQAVSILGFTHWARGDLEAAYRALADWSAAMRRVGNISFVVAGAFGLAEIRAAQGRLRDAVAIYEQTLQLAAEHDRQVQLVTPHLYLGLAMLYHEQGRHAAVAPLLAQGRELGELTPIIDWPFRWRRAQAQLKADEGDFGAALALLDDARRHYVRNPVPEARPIAALQAQAHLRRGDLDQAQAWAAASGVTPNDEPSYLREFEHLVLARLLIAAYRRDRDARALRDAHSLLARLFTAAEAGGRMSSVIEILLLQALAHAAGGAGPAARAALGRALALAEPEGYVQLFAREGPPLAQLLARMKGEGERMQAYLHTLLAAFGMQEAVHPASRIPHPSTEPLSPREIEVLRLIAQGLSNQQIAERLSLALSSVKGHNLRIFGKLQVQRRTEAIARAQELGLLG